MTLVLNKSHKVAYPKSDGDFDALRTVGTSIKFCSPDFLPLLEGYCKKHGYQVVVEAFENLQAKAVANLGKKWPGTLDINDLVKRGVMHMSCPRDQDHFDQMKSVRSALVSFYAQHGMLVKYTIKRGARNVKVTFTIEINPEVFVTQDPR